MSTQVVFLGEYVKIKFVFSVSSLLICVTDGTSRMPVREGCLRFCRNCRSADRSGATLLHGNNALKGLYRENDKRDGSGPW